MKGYFGWLREQIGDRSHSNLARYLYKRTFVAVLAGDRNRGADGEALRSGFADAPMADGCTVLEMLVALAIRAEDMAEGMISEEENTAKNWYRMMIRNLGLGILDDDFWERNPVDSEAIAEERIDKWMSRDYEYDGFGGLFPLENPKDDQAKVEIWYQLNAYLMEKMAAKL